MCIRDSMSIVLMRRYRLAVICKQIISQQFIINFVNFRISFFVTCTVSSSLLRSQKLLRLQKKSVRCLTFVEFCVEFYFFYVANHCSNWWPITFLLSSRRSLYSGCWNVDFLNSSFYVSMTVFTSVTCSCTIKTAIPSGIRAACIRLWWMGNVDLC